MTPCGTRWTSPRCSQPASRAMSRPTRPPTPARGADRGGRVVVFLELSLTGYELDAVAVALDEVALALLVERRVR